MLWLNVSLHGATVRWTVLTIGALPVRRKTFFTAVNLKHLGHDAIYKNVYLFFFIFLFLLFASWILERMVSFLMYSESIPGGDMVRALWTIVAFRYDVPRLNVSFDSSHMWWLEHTVSALPLPSGRHSLLTGVDFIHLGHDNIYNIRFTLV